MDEYGLLGQRFISNQTISVGKDKHMAFDTLIGHFVYGGEEYSFVTTTELKFNQNGGHWVTNIGVQTGSDKVKEMLYDLFNHQLKIKIKFDLRRGKQVVVHDCHVRKYIPYTFGAQAEIEGYMESIEYVQEKVQFT
jgi:hypothetical protein